jgi:hypothetical protein
VADRRRPLPDLTDTSGMFNWARDQLPGRPQYLWGALHAARLARALGHDRVTVIELGVAGGHGLIDLERAAEVAEDLLGVTVEVVGFDIGSGMPEPVDQRDIPWAIQAGIFPMDEPELRGRLRRADLIIGPVTETIPQWLESTAGSVGFVAVDLDMYSSTIQAFTLFEAPAERLLPRVALYFDDIFGYGWSDFAGERAAITDFNTYHEQRKLSPFYGLEYELTEPDRKLSWPHKIFMAHLFDSPDYTKREWQIPPGWVAVHRLGPHTST